MGNLFQRMYIGDPNKRKDLTKKAVREQSRFSLFFTVLKVRGTKLISLNLLYSLFLLPTFFVLYFMLYHYGMGQEVDNPLSSEHIIAYLYMLFPCMLIASPGAVGFTNVLHRWANDEHAWMSDFWTGIKKNWKQGLIVSAINYLVLLFLIYCAWWWSVWPQNTPENFMEEIFVTLGYPVTYFLFGCIFVYFAVHMYVFPLMVRYKLTIKEIYKYSAILAFKNLFGTVAMIFFTLLMIYVVLVVPYMQFAVPLFMLSLVYLVIYVHLGWVFNRHVFLDPKD